MCDNDEDYDGNAMFTIMKIKTTCSPDGSVAPGITAGSLQMLLIMFKMIKNKMDHDMDDQDQDERVVLVLVLVLLP